MVGHICVYKKGSIQSTPKHHVHFILKGEINKFRSYINVFVFIFTKSFEIENFAIIMIK